MAFNDILDDERFPRSSKYSAAWVAEHPFGANPLWLCEWLTSAMELEPGMRVLDLGCGRAKSSVFLAREYGVQVFATDLWIQASEAQVMELLGIPARAAASYQELAEPGVVGDLGPILFPAGKAIPYDR